MSYDKKQKQKLMDCEIASYVETIKLCKNINSIIQILKKIESNDSTLYDLIIIYQKYKKQNEYKIFKNKNISDLLKNVDNWCDDFYLDAPEDYFEDYRHTIKLKHIIFQES